MELVKREDHWALYNEDGHKIAATLPGCNSKLSIKNCESIANGYDLEELSENVYREYPTESKNSGFEYNRDRHVFRKRKAFIKGFEKCLELIGDKKFSEEDVISMIEKSRETGLTAEYLILNNQQTEFDVEIVTEPYVKYVSRSLHTVYPPLDIQNKLDKDGCLILKRR